MPSVLKKFIIKIIYRIIRVILFRRTVIKESNQPPAPTPDEPGWRRLRVRPFVYVTNQSKESAADFPKYFLVTSQGLAGSAWPSSSLTLHPDITCAMGIDHPFISMRYYYNHEEVKQKINSVHGNLLFIRMLQVLIDLADHDSKRR